MLDPTITPLFESCDYASFAQHVGKYRHDLLNRQGNVQLGCNIISRFLARLPDSPFLEADSVQQAMALANELVEQCHTTTDAVRDVLWFPEEEQLLSADDEDYARFDALQSQWDPYDGQAWESLLISLSEAITPHVENLGSQLDELRGNVDALLAACAEDEAAATMLTTVSDELESAVDSLQGFADLMDLGKIVYIPEEDRWETTE